MTSLKISPVLAKSMAEMKNIKDRFSNSISIEQLTTSLHLNFTTIK